MKENRPVRGLDPIPAEQELARKDAAFPALGILVDAELFSGLVRLHAARDPGVGRLVDLRYRPGIECLATYVFGSGDHESWVHARALQPGEPPPADDDEAAPARNALGLCRERWPDYGLAVRAFPCDDGLPALASLGERTARARLLAAVLPDARADRLSTRTISYDPERRWLGEVEGPDGPVAALRIHAPNAFPFARWSAQGLRDAEGLLLPRVLGRSREHCATAVAWARGRPLGQTLLDPGLPRVEMEAVGAAIAELHAQDPTGLPSCPPAGDAPAVRATASTLGFVLPRAEPRARRTADVLVRRLVEVTLEEQPIHGRLEPAKLLLQGGGRVVVLDLDRACRGSQARDAGSLIAHLERAAVVGEVARARADWAADAFLDGYDRTTRFPLRRRDVRLHTALALFELALGPFRCLAPEWPDRTMALLDRTEALLGR